MSARKASVAAAVPDLRRWRPPKGDGIAHLYPTRGHGPALCGVVNQEERHDWPKGRRCGDCDRLHEQPALTPGEAQELFGK